MTERQANNCPSIWNSLKFRHGVVVVIFLAVMILLAYRLEHIITPLLVSLLIAYIFDPFISWLEKKGASRLGVVIILFMVMILVVVAGLVLAVPQIISQVQDIGHWFVRHSKDIRQIVHEHLSPAKAQHVTQEIEKNFATYSDRTVRYIFNYVGVVLGSTFTIINLVILIPIYTFFFLWRFGPVAETISRFLPLQYKERILDVTGQINLVTANFFRGRLLICLAVGLLTAIGFQIVGVPLAWPLGLAIGVLNLIPFLAPVVGLPVVLAICYINSHNWQLPMYALSAFIIPQVIDGWLLTPLVQGKSIGLHPITTIVVLMIGSDLAGMLGLLLAIPAAAAIKIIFKEFAWPVIAESAGLDREAIEGGGAIKNQDQPKKTNQIDEG